MKLIDANALRDILYRYKRYGLDDDEERIHNSAIDQCIIALNAASDIEIPQWIPVAERLPEPFLPVLIWYTYFMFERYITPEQTYGFGFVNLDGNWYIEGGGEQKKVIAWMPLPKPYDPYTVEQEDKHEKRN